MQVSINKNPLGFHYYPDTFHYREKDLKTLLPRLRILEANWLTLQAHPERAIPEPFIRALLENNITPIIHIPLAINPIHDINNLRVLMRAYASWGVKYIAIFDRPNLKTSWNSSAWSQMDLVDRFLDIFLPVAEILKSEDLTPMFPPLEPGGDYWDTTFLQSALEGMLKRGKQELLSSMALTAYAWTYGQDIFWGKGGPEKWSGARPYMTPANCQDQFGFFIFDWYQAIARKSLGHTLPIFLLAAGCRKSDCAKESDSQKPTPHQFEETNATLYQLVTKSHSDHQSFSKELKACNFWLLSAAENQPESEDAWFSEQNQPNPVVNLITKHQTKKSNHLFPKDWADSEAEDVSKSIGHYILLPKYSWDAKDWLYEVAESVSGVILAEFGYSIADTLLARRVTIVGSTRWVEESIFNKLSSTGCVIEEYYGDGTLIASKLLNL